MKLKHRIPYLILPLITYTYGSFAFLSRIMRIGMIDVVSQDYIRTARAKGLSEWVVIVRHVIKNALIPFVTVLGLQFGAFLGGSVVTESIFDWPGLGRLLLQSIHTRDYPVLQGTILVIVFSFVIVSQPSNISGTVAAIPTPTYTASSKTFTATATYTHNGSELTTDNFTYKAIDGGSPSYVSNIATAIITTTSVNDAPVAANVYGSGFEGGTITTTLTATDVDSSDPSTFTFTIVSAPTNLLDDNSDGIADEGDVTIASPPTYNASSKTFTALIPEMI